MRKLVFYSVSIVILVSMVLQSCSDKKTAPVHSVSDIPLDSSHVAPFFKSYPELSKYKEELNAIYRNYDFHFIWFDQEGIVTYGNSLYEKVQNIQAEGISSTFPYQKEIDSIFEENFTNAQGHHNADLLITSLYLYYVDQVYKGIDDKSTKNIGWLLPRKRVAYTDLLDSIISDQQLQSEDSLTLSSQYYRLRGALKHYRAIELDGGWIPIELEKNHKGYKPNDTSAVIQQVRNRLFTTGELKNNNENFIYDAELVDAVCSFQMHNGYKPDSLISPALIKSMNITVEERIKTIVVNMERCRWISPEFFRAEDYITVNIPSFTMNFIQEGKMAIQSSVVVGKSMTKTNIFTGNMSYIAFSPYWNVPNSIIEKEVKPGMAKNANYLKSHNMEWNGGKVRQLPGINNSLGLVKFMFPNSNNIYLHDSPAKSLYEKDDRARSHGCIRVEKARELAIAILEKDGNWPVEKVDSAMNAGKENIYTLNHEIPVYIAYFTAWVDDQGKINFYKDIYKRDDRLAALLFYKK